MVNRFLALWLCVAPGIAPAQYVGTAESAPLREEGATAGGTPVQQILARVDPETAGSLAELRAGEIESFLADLAKELVSRDLQLEGKIAPDFKGTALRPATEAENRSQGPLETFRGVAHTETSVTHDSLAGEFDALLADYRSVDWAKFKVVSIEPLGQQAAKTSLNFQLAGLTKGGYRQQSSYLWRCEWNKSPEGSWMLARIEVGPSERARSRVAAFHDISQSAFGANASFLAQVRFGTESWR